MSIRYRMNYEKAVETIIWLAKQKPGIDIYHVAKVIFYAEKMHINQYARPIIGDTYRCVDYGPMPSGVHDLITKDSWLSPDHLKLVNDTLLIEESPYPQIKSLRNPNMEYFSGTDLECLKKSLREYGELSFDELKKLTHDERCYIETGYKQEIDYALMIDDDNPKKEEIIQEMYETSPYVQV